MTGRAATGLAAGPSERGAQEARRALRCAWHLAVVAGPDTGWCAGLSTALEVGRAPDPSGGAALPLDDVFVSRRHLALRLRRGRVEARDLGSANGSRCRPPRRRWLPRPRGDDPASGFPAPGRRRRRLGSRWRPLRAGSRLELGRTVLELRPRPVELRPPEPPEPEPSSRPRRDWIRLAMPLLMCLAMVPLLLSGAAGWWRWLILLVPFAVAGSLLGGRREPTPDPPDPATVLLLAAARPAPPAEEAVLRLRLCTGGRARRRAAATTDLAAGDRVALVGSPTNAEGTLRWLTGQLLVCHRARVEEAGVQIGPEPEGASTEAPAVAAGRDLPPPWRVRVHRATRGERPEPAFAADSRAVHLVLATRLEDVPAWCTRVLPAAHAGVGAAWAATVGELAHPASTGTAGLPADLRLAGLLGPPEHLPAWRERPGLTASIGVDGEGPVELDLVTHGPHALLAGTTGAGKSELLLAWLLSLAVRHSPRELQLVLVDYKGGATFARLRQLPHVAGVLTDLDPAGTTRALRSLRAELRRREALFAEAGVADVAGYLARGGPPLPRLLVAVDEFRALADSHPEVLDALVRLATQGRSLGVHLILATQRPGGAVGGELRANLTVRICLRVLDPVESQDVVGSPAAAGLPAVPGRAVIRADRLRTLQAPWAGPGGYVEEVVARTREAWDRTRRGRAAPRPWAPPLPETVGLWAMEGSADGRLALGRTDLPEEQRLGTWRWEPEALLVLGGAGTGRTTTLRTIGTAALAAGWAVHVLAADPAPFAGLPGPGLGTVAGTGDPRRMARLLEILRGRCLLLVDDADAVAESLDAVTGAGQGSALLSRALREARRTGVRGVLAAPASLAGARWLEGPRARLVLAPRDETEGVLAGVPRELLGGPARPGRGVLLEPGRATTVQVALPGEATTGEHLPPPGTAAPSDPDPGASRSPAPIQVASLPERVRRAELSPPGSRRHAPLGLGGDTSGEVAVACGPGEAVLVTGPSGSGRSTALRTLADGLRRAGRRVSEPLPDGAPGDDVVLLDDAERWPAHRLEELDAVATARGLTVVIAARAESVAAAYRGPLALWRSRATLVLLRPASPVVARLTDVDLRTAIDPVRPHHPGLGVVVADGRATPVQVAA